MSKSVLQVKIVILRQMTPQFQDGAKVVDIIAESWWVGLN